MLRARLRMVDSHQGASFSDARVPLGYAPLTELKRLALLSTKRRPPTKSLSSTANSRRAWSTRRTKSNEFSGCSRIGQRRSTITGHWNARLAYCALKSSESNRNVLLPAAVSPLQTSLSPCAKSARRSPKPSGRSREAPPSAVCWMRLKVFLQSCFSWLAAAPCLPFGSR